MSGGRYRLGGGAAFVIVGAGQLRHTLGEGAVREGRLRRESIPRSTADGVLTKQLRTTLCARRTARTCFIIPGLRAAPESAPQLTYASKTYTSQQTSNNATLLRSSFQAAVNLNHLKPLENLLQVSVHSYIICRFYDLNITIITINIY